MEVTSGVNLSSAGADIEGQGDSYTIDNPDEMLEEDQQDQDDDPDILEEIDRRKEEIIEQFMELSYTCKEDAQEIVQSS